MHIASLVMGIVSFIFSWIPVWGFVLAIAALVIAIIAMASKKSEEKGKGMKIAGIVLSIIATVIALVVTISSVLLLRAVVDTGKELIDDAQNATMDFMNQFENEIDDTVDDLEDEKEDVIDASKDSTHLNSSNASTESILDITNLDGAKCLNTNGMSYEYSTIKHNHGVYVSIKNNKVFFGVNNDELGEDNIKIEKYKDYEIIGINAQDISEIYVSGWGQAVVCPAVYFLMKDGSIIWLNSEDAIANKDFAVEGKIPNVENVVRIVNAYASGGFGGGSTILGLKADGTFYDLCLETVNKQ